MLFTGLQRRGLDSYGPGTPTRTDRHGAFSFEPYK
jgi:hypothetical protein